MSFMQTLLATIVFAIVVGFPNAITLIMLLNAWPLRHIEPQLSAKVQKQRQKNLVDGARIARSSMIFVIGAAMFYFGLNLGERRLDATAIQLSLEGLFGALLPLIAWLWLSDLARKYLAEHIK